ncbi:CAP domain-containing protein [Archangium violaceum]|uniref:CAP domain-containing protein n=1 Tax=Archangium violaceum TaxID=83451 RepID=UPI00193B65ED|nr:CAP domain-containing protein [Archangium violaceum]QRK05841.1 CAP domain-containing protein [Archangium violaceum]
MLVLALGALLAATPLTSASMEQQASRYVLQEFERVGRRAPQADPALTQAARRLAREALDDSPSGAVELLALTEAVSDSGGSDPSPRSYVIRAWEREHAVDTLLARKDLNQEPASHMGLGVAVKGERATLVLLLTERKATLERFPRAFDKPGIGQSLCGRLESPLRGTEVYVTRPDGRVEHPPLTRESGPSFCSRLLFPTEGRYTVELIGRGERGPEVAALFLVDVGSTKQRGERERLVEPTTVEDARVAVLERINALRRAHDLKPLALDDTLNGVAQAYSDRMAKEGFFAHVAPDGSDLRGRLASAGSRYRIAGENLGLASGPLAAHFGIELSPGHRGNLLGTQFTHAGIGVTFQKVDGRDQAIVTEVFSANGGSPESAAPVDPLEEAYRALATHRASRGLPPLERNPVLERIARDHARRALEQDQPRVQLPGSKVHERVFEALDTARSASVDFYVAESPSLLPDSKNLGERKNTLVGVGAVRGDSRTYGKGQYWMVVIYAATR